RNGTPGSGLSYKVDFIIATIPDYVDSNSGWLADQGLGAIQSSMARSGYLLDRLRLIDWSRSSAKPGGPASLSRVHEHQPGALIFRTVEPSQGGAREEDRMQVPVQLQVVLLVLETPTAGVHHAALRNAASFIRAWRRCT